MFARFPEYEYFVTAALCVLALMGMGTTLTATAFRDVARRPRTLLLILFTQLIVAPLLAIALSQILGQPAGIAIGMVLVTALPGGLFSNVFTLLSRGSVALSVSATSLCTISSLLTTTFVLKTFGSAHLPGHFEMPLGHILFEIIVCLLLPLLMGVAIARLFPRQSKSIGRSCVRAASAVLVFYVFAALQSGRINLSAYGWQTHSAIILLILLQLGACGLLSYAFRVTSLELYTCQLEVVNRNVNLGLLLKASLFPVVASGSDDFGSAILFVLLYYGGASIVTGLIMTIVRRIELYVMGDRHRALPPPELQGW